jgi:hypothetical protein
VLYCERLLYLEYVQGEWADIAASREPLPSTQSLSCQMFMPFSRGDDQSPDDRFRILLATTSAVPRLPGMSSCFGRGELGGLDAVRKGAVN